MADTRVFRTKSNIEAEGIKSLLENSSIKAMVINKMDSAHGSLFGYIEIFVSEIDASEAYNLINSYLSK